MCTSEAAKVTIGCGSQSVAKTLNSGTFQLDIRNSVGICFTSGTTKKSHGAIPQTQHEVSHFDLIFYMTTVAV